MPVLELASLHLKNGTKLTDEDLKSTLIQAKQAMETSSGLGDKFLYLQQKEDPTIIYIVGRWPSVDYHHNVFIPSAANQAILDALADKVDVNWMFHLDISQSVNELPFTKAPVMAIGRHFIAPGERQAFNDTFEAQKAAVVNAADKRAQGGWRIDKEEETKDEWVLFSGWESIDGHKAFGDTPEFQEYSKIRAHLAGAEIKHAVVLNL